jgi:hypothetical protein
MLADVFDWCTICDQFILNEDLTMKMKKKLILALSMIAALGGSVAMAAEDVNAKQQADDACRASPYCLEMFPVVRYGYTSQMWKVTCDNVEPKKTFLPTVLQSPEQKTNDLMFRLNPDSGKPEWMWQSAWPNNDAGFTIYSTAREAIDGYCSSLMEK